MEDKKRQCDYCGAWTYKDECSACHMKRNGEKSEYLLLKEINMALRNEK